MLGRHSIWSGSVVGYGGITIRAASNLSLGNPPDPDCSQREADRRRTRKFRGNQRLACRQTVRSDMLRRYDLGPFWWRRSGFLLDLSSLHQTLHSSRTAREQLANASSGPSTRVTTTPNASRHSSVPGRRPTAPRSSARADAPRSESIEHEEHERPDGKQRSRGRR